GNVFYYGGSNPNAVPNAQGPASAGGTWGRVHGWSFASGNYETERAVSPDTVILTDALPNRNAAFFGYTGADAYNDAYQSLPGYFRKSDLLRSAQQDCSGAWIVPADAPYYPCGGPGSGTMSIKPYVRPTTAPQPVIVIPKDMLDKPIQKPQDTGRKVVSAN